MLKIGYQIICYKISPENTRTKLLDAVSMLLNDCTSFTLIYKTPNPQR